MAPLVAFCIRCIINAFHTRVFGELKHIAGNETVLKNHRSKGERWRYALGDAWEPKKMDAESTLDSAVSNGVLIPVVIFILTLPSKQFHWSHGSDVLILL